MFPDDIERQMEELNALREEDISLPDIGEVPDPSPPAEGGVTVQEISPTEQPPRTESGGEVETTNELLRLLLEELQGFRTEVSEVLNG